MRLGGLSIGTAPLGGLYAPLDEDQAQATLRAAHGAGVRLFDTAPHYGRGLAEERVGAFLRSLPDPAAAEVLVSTKVGRLVGPLPERAEDDIFLGAPPGASTFDFSAGGIRASLDASRARLGRDRIDIALVHDPEDHLADALGEAWTELRRQREEGAVGAIGVGTNHATTALRFLDQGDVDVVLLAGRITLLERSGEPVAARCADLDVTLLTGGVLQSGVLAGGSTYDYAPAPAAIEARVQDLSAVCAAHDVDLLTAAIAHPLRFPGVTSALVGVRHPDEVSAAVRATSTTLPDALWRDLDQIRTHANEGET